MAFSTETTNSKENSDISNDPPSTCSTIVQSQADHTHTIIFLHGREDFGEDLAKYLFDSKSSDDRSLAELFPSVRWVFPTAKLRYCARRDEEFSTSSFAELLKGEEIISQWFDIWDIENPTEKQELMIDGLRESMEDILEIIREEAKIVPLERIVLAGISQGCATAFLTLLSSRLRLSGFIGLCSWLPFQQEIAGMNSEKISQKVRDIFWDSGSTKIFEAPPENLNEEDLNTVFSKLWIEQDFNTTPIFLAHSRDDETVPFSLGQGLRQTTQDLGFQVTWKEYEDGGHWLNAEHGVDDIVAFIRGVWEI